MAEARATIRNREGIHCRPAALIVGAVREYAGKAVLCSGRRKADLSSVMQVLSLGLRHGDEVTVRVTGPDAEQKCRELAALIGTDFNFEPRNA